MFKSGKRKLFSMLICILQKVTFQNKNVRVNQTRQKKNRPWQVLDVHHGVHQESFCSWPVLGSQHCLFLVTIPKKRLEPDILWKTKLTYICILLIWKYLNIMIYDVSSKLPSCTWKILMPTWRMQKRYTWGLRNSHASAAVLVTWAVQPRFGCRICETRT